MATDNGSAKAESAIVAICAILTTLMVFTIQTQRSHEAAEGHPGVLKLVSSQTAQIESLTFQANENRRRLTLLEERVAIGDQSHARLTEAIRGMESIPTIISRVSTIEAEIKVLDRTREQRIEQSIHGEGGTR